MKNLFAKVGNFFGKIKSWSRKRWLILVIILGAIGYGCYRAYDTWRKEKGGESEYFSSDMQVSRGDIVQELLFFGRANFADAQKLTFPQSGKITAVYKKIGDLVKDGEIIAKMDSYEVDNELEQARINLENAQRALEKLMDGSQTQYSILQAEKEYNDLKYDVDNEQKTVQLALKDIENEYANKKIDYDKAVQEYQKKIKDYESMKKTYDQIYALDKGNQILNTDDILQTKADALEEIAISLKKELEGLDKLMHYTDTFGTDQPNYLVEIGLKDMNTKNAVEVGFWKLSSAAEQLKTWAKSFDPKAQSEVQAKSDLIQKFEEVRLLAGEKDTFSENVDLMFEKSIPSADASWSPVSIGNGKSLATQAKTAIDDILGLATPKTIGEKRAEELQDTKIALDKQKQDLEKMATELEQATLTLEKKKSDVHKEAEMKKVQLALALTKLKDLERGDSDELRMQKNTVKQLEKNVETIMKKYDEYLLKANFDGVITKLNMQVGDSVGGNANSSNSEEKYVYIENPENLEMLLDIDQTDVVKLATGMPVEITLDALPDSPYTGKISEIDTSGGGNGGGDMYGGGGGGSTTYQAKVIFTKKPEDNILGSMTASARIILDEVRDTLIVPNIAVSLQNGENVVMKLLNGKYVTQPVVLGMADDNNVEIVEGLAEGDTIMGVFMTEEGMDTAGVNQKEEKMMY